MFISQCKTTSGFQGLLLAKEKGSKKLIVQIDLIIVVGTLKGSMTCNARHHGIVQRWNDLLQSLDWEVRVTHCYRELNQVADSLVNLGVGLNGDFVYFNEPPRKVLTLLYADQVGAKFSKLIVNQ